MYQLFTDTSANLPTAYCRAHNIQVIPLYYYIDGEEHTCLDTAAFEDTAYYTAMKEGKAVIALEGNKFAGFSYIESWGNKQYVTTSGLIVHPDFRGLGIAKRIKEMTFQLARMRWPHAKIFSLTSGAAVMKMNTELGYVPVTFADLTDDEAFWRGCESCVNHDILERTGRRYCICTGMLFDPDDPHRAEREAREIKN